MACGNKQISAKLVGFVTVAVCIAALFDPGYR